MNLNLKKTSHQAKDNLNKKVRFPLRRGNKFRDKRYDDLFEYIHSQPLPQTCKFRGADDPRLHHQFQEWEVGSTEAGSKGSVSGTENDQHGGCGVRMCSRYSCNRTNARRYRNFAQMVCERTGATNAYGHIIINGKRSKLHRSKMHMVCDAANEEIHLDPDMFNPSAKVLLFDDIVSSGKSMREFAKMVEETGAKVIGAIALGHTKHYKH